eukprot:scaffold78233_cov32-Tisochrysis_lutea.AAC.3
MSALFMTASAAKAVLRVTCECSFIISPRVRFMSRGCWCWVALGPRGPAIRHSHGFMPVVFAFFRAVKHGFKKGIRGEK